jgi:hypothetical protein
MSFNVEAVTYTPPPPPKAIENITITLDPDLAKRLAVLLYYTTESSRELDQLSFAIRDRLAREGYEDAFSVSDPKSIRAITDEMGSMLASEWSVLREVMRDHMSLDVRVA